MEHYLPFDDQEINCKFRERVDRLTSKKNTMDIFEQIAEMAREEGVEKGKKEAKEAIVRDLMAGTKFSDEKIASLTRIPVRRVASIRKKLHSEKR
jgi:hypothetical protein